MRALSVLLVVFSTLFGISVVRANTNDSAADFSATAFCVAALEQRLKSQVVPPASPQARAQGLQTLQSAYALAGTAYLRGLRGEKGKELLNVARTAVAGLSESRRTQEATRCFTQGQAALASASTAHRWLIEAAANRRLERQLAVFSN